MPPVSRRIRTTMSKMVSMGASVVDGFAGCTQADRPAGNAYLGPATQVAPLVQRFALAQRGHGARIDVEVVRRV
jgi:hypothetical protein